MGAGWQLGFPVQARKHRQGESRELKHSQGKAEGNEGSGGWLEMLAGSCGFCPSPEPGAHRFVILLCPLDSQLLPEAQVVPQPRHLPPAGALKVPPSLFPFFSLFPSSRPQRLPALGLSHLTLLC